MADAKKNALAELAKAMNTPAELAPVETNGLIVLSKKQFEAYQKALLIVTELANVDDKREGESNVDALWRCNDCIAKCRAIAEEGAEDGK